MESGEREREKKEKFWERHRRRRRSLAPSTPTLDLKPTASSPSPSSRSSGPQTRTWRSSRRSGPGSTLSSGASTVSFDFDEFLLFRFFERARSRPRPLSPTLSLVHDLPSLHNVNNHATVNGTSKTTSVRNMDAEEVAAAAALLRSSAGRKASVRAPPRRRVPAEATKGGVQGGWRPGVAEEMMKARREA